MNAAEMAPSPSSTVDNTPSPTPPRDREIISYREVKIAPAIMSRTRLRKTQSKQG